MDQDSGNNVSRASTLLFTVCVPLFLVTASVAWAFNDPGLYQRGFEKYNVPISSGIDEADLAQVGAELREYFNSREEPLYVRTRVYGEERELFNDREVHHMRDVKRLVWGVYAVAVVSGAYLAIVTARSLISGRSGALRLLARRLVWGGCATVVGIALFGVFAITGFEAVFVLFHRISFANDLWQLDPRTDYLLVLFPLGFWFDATVSVVLRSIAGALALAGAGSAWLVWQRSRRDRIN
jgi:integral membrane protein (TIGR01906 family)